MLSIIAFLFCNFIILSKHLFVNTFSQILIFLSTLCTNIVLFKANRKKQKAFFKCAFCRAHNFLIDGDFRFLARRCSALLVAYHKPSPLSIAQHQMVDFRLHLVNSVEYARANQLESGKMQQAENGDQKTSAGRTTLQIRRRTVILGLPKIFFYHNFMLNIEKNHVPAFMHLTK